MSRNRKRVFERDRGKCAQCSTHTEVLIEGVMQADDCSRAEAIKFYGELWGFGWACKTLWQADHRLPRHRGGGDELENLQTLCLRCHAKKTRMVDVPDAAKDRRKRKKHERHQERMRAKFNC